MACRSLLHSLAYIFFGDLSSHHRGIQNGDSFQVIFLKDIPEIEYILDSAGKAMKVGGMAVDISSSIAKDLSKISDDFVETLQILFKFQTTYEDTFDSKI